MPKYYVLLVECDGCDYGATKIEENLDEYFKLVCSTSSWKLYIEGINLSVRKFNIKGDIMEFLHYIETIKNYSYSKHNDYFIKPDFVPLVKYDPTNKTIPFYDFL